MFIAQLRYLLFGCSPNKLAAVREKEKSPLNYVLVERTKEGLLLISAGYRKYKTYEWICILTQLNAKAHGSFGKVSTGEKSTGYKGRLHADQELTTTDTKLPYRLSEKSGQYVYQVY